MSSSNDSDMELTPNFINLEAKAVVESLLPEASKKRYIKTYEDFMKWRTDKKIKSLSENVFIIYFNELSKKLQPSTLWSTYSMLKTTLNTRHDVNLKDFTKLIAFVKRQSDGFRSKKSKVFTAQNVETFLNEAPDELFLATKVVLIFGISGACRSAELTNIKVTDVEKQGQLLLVKLPNTKTKIDRTFVIRGEFTELVEKYRNLRPEDMQSNRFFLNYQRGKCYKQVIGKNKIANIPKQIAQYLNLPNTELYTGHCFRRTSATLLADSGADLTLLKRHGGWKSSTVAEGYIEESIENKTKISSKITETINLRSDQRRPDTYDEIDEPRPGTSKDLHIEMFKNVEPKEGVPLENTSDTSSYPRDETRDSPTFTESQVTQTVSNVNIPGKNVSLSFKHCSNFTINFK